jgi:hypothetical protein
LVVVSFIGENSSILTKDADVCFVQASKETTTTCCGTDMCLCKSGRHHHHYHHFLSSPVEEQRAATKLFQRFLSAANLFTSLHVFPSLRASSNTDLLQVCLGLPLFLVPWGFQSNAIRSTAVSSFLIVCPIHFHFRFLNRFRGFVENQYGRLIKSCPGITVYKLIHNNA